MDDLHGANALLTGATGGLGGHIARALGPLEVAQVNLLAPMLLTRHAQPGMLARGRGGNAFNVPYTTTKAGLLGCARSYEPSLRARP